MEIHHSRTLTAHFGQAPLYAKTVFSFFRPDHMPVALRDENLVSPELEIFDPRFAGELGNRLANYALYNHHDQPNARSVIGLDFDEIRPLFGNPDALVERLNTIYLAGAMPDELRALLVETIRALPADAHPYEGVTHALALLVATPDFAVQR